MKTKKIHFKTLGCKTNQYETQAMREKFHREGYEVTRDPAEADLFVINTCTVTAEADRKSRSIIRRLHRDNPDAQIAVTGCYATLNGEEIAGLPGVSLVVPNEEKDRIVEHVKLESFSKYCGEGDETENNRYGDFAISYFEDHSRGFVKIQDGCNHSCTYCKVVIVRGVSRSRPIEEVVDEANRLVEAGHKEIVLTGIQLGDYGAEWKNDLNLVEVLRRLNAIDGLFRIRMSSIDPSDISDELIEFMRDHVKVCPQLHMSLQSGDDGVLKLMKRAYRRDYYIERIQKLRAVVPEFALTTDVMVGFPGEDDAAHRKTLELLREVRPLKAHVFPFSPREGTAAQNMPGRATGTVLKSRLAELQALCKQEAERFQQSYIGKPLTVLVETQDASGYWEGHSSNFLKVKFQGGADLERELIEVVPTSVEDGYLLGDALSALNQKR